MDEIIFDTSTMNDIKRYVALWVATKGIQTKTHHLYVKDPTALIINDASRVLDWINGKYDED